MMVKSDRKRKDAALHALKNLRNRLLDLTGRNRLINFRHTKRGSLRVIDELPNQLVETLLAEKEMRFLPVPEPSRVELIEAGYIKIDEETGQEIRILKDPSAEQWAKHLGLSTKYEVPKSDGSEVDGRHSDDAIQTLLYPYELESKIKNLLHLSESAIQEMGANILYLSFGFLEWFDSTNDNARIAPLFLLPARLQKGRVNPKLKTYEFVLSYSGEDLIPNLSLREKLRADFALSLPDLDENTTPESYFKEVLDLIEVNQPRWKVRRYITLTLLNFSKLLMYLDLDPERWPEDSDIIAHPLVTKFLDGYDPENGTDDISEVDFGFGEEYLIDEMDEIHIKYPLVDDADSSQHSALIDAVNGKNLVIEGPPGTGKSQTITNLIAASLSQGKRVLFVAEKLAALEVVRRRLDAVDLGEFCLELHSHKSQKRKILDEVEGRLNKHRCYYKPTDIEIDIARFEDLKTELKKHAERINKPWKKTSKSLHEIFMAATLYRERIKINPDNLHPEGYDGKVFDVATQRFLMDQVEGYRRVYQAVAGQLDGETDLQLHPWYGVNNGDLQIFDLVNVKDALKKWQDSLEGLINKRELLSEELNCKKPLIPNSLNGILSLLNDLQSLPALKGDEFLDKLPILNGVILEKGKGYLNLFLDIQKQYANLSKKVGTEVLKDLSPIDSFLKGNKQLGHLVGKTVALSELSEAINRLTAIQTQLSDLEEPLKQIHKAIGDNAAGLLLPSSDGLNELKEFITIVSSLKPSYWKLRNELFDNEEMDELVPKLRDELTKLLILQKEIFGTFKIDLLPSKEELLGLKHTLEDGGLLRWLKSSWRSARKKVIGLAINNKIKLSEIEILLEKAAMFSDQLYKIENNQKYKETFGDFIEGVDTDLSVIEELRGWYRKIRQRYGIGFGQKVELGSAILSFPRELARAVRSLSEQGLQSQIADIIDDLGSLKVIFSPVSKMQDSTTVLSGNDGLITWLLSSLDKAIKSCGPLVSDNSISITELASRIEALSCIKETIAEWKKADFDNHYFQGEIGLKTDFHSDNSSALSMLNNTLEIANWLEYTIESNILKEYIVNQPSVGSFKKLSLLFEHLKSSVEVQNTYFDAFKQMVGLNKQDWMGKSNNDLNSIINRNHRAFNNGNALQNWLDYIRIRDHLGSMGLAKLIDLVEHGEIDVLQIEDAYQAGIYDLLAREIFREQPELAKFSGFSQNALQKKFKEYDNKLKKLQCQQIAWKIDQTNIPSGKRGVRVSEHTDLFLLKWECSKKTRHIPIRQLLLRAGRALLAIKPCFMMGPMSVAQYLAPGQLKFDLIVMDEASQIKPQDALGAIARGSQLVVVGDPKQLPPTNFFERVVNIDEEDPTSIEESESILDATLPIFPGRRLRWHYRSQHESLIAFSNHSFYKSDMVLFPSPHKDTDRFGIKYLKVKRGCFVNRRNSEEAKIISKAVKEHITNYPEDSIGVVAMSSEQRLQIEREIEIHAKEDPLFQTLLETDSLKEEPLFIKNLENVQGDERDVILISMTYGPQEPEGRVFQRFGPINSDVGWRRLNVLFTRSKKQMQIFSSMGSEDIVADSTAKRGVKALRNFLSFCETGILHKTERDTGRPPDSDFEIAVMDALHDEGFDCIPQVGVAGFFIDLTVVDPGNPGRYLMGIECDGATYHSAKSVRDRDRLRQSILERLGWKIRRIWSTDWFKNPHGELQPIIRELHSLKTIRVEKEQEETEHLSEEIEANNGESQDEEIIADKLISEKIGLKEALISFDNEVIRKKLPDTPDHQRLLRPAMLEAFSEYMPCSKSEFLEYIPPYLRQATLGKEGQFLQAILSIINANVEEVY